MKESTMIYLKNADIVLEHEIANNCDMLLKDGKILSIGKVDTKQYPDACEIDCENLYAVPGFIDIHVHGGGGYDFMDWETEAVEEILKIHQRHGTTAIYPTTLASDIEETIKSIDRISRYKEGQSRDICQVMGIHLEGPYFNPVQKGAQPEKFIKIPQKQEYERLLSCPDVKRISFAPELDNSAELARYAEQNNLVGAIAHTNGSYNDVLKVMDYGVNLVTHLYSGMPVVYRENGYRQIGIAETGLLLDDLFVEVIADGKHLPKELLRFIYKNKGNDKLILVTDAMRAAGQEVTHSFLGSREYGLPVTIRDGVAFAPDGENFAGSIATMDSLVRNMVFLAGVSLVNAVKMASLNAAKVMRIDTHKGSLKAGKDADIVLLDKDLYVKQVIINGNLCPQA